MSQDLKTHDQQVSAENQQSVTQQKKIDPVAQLKWLNNQQVDQGWGVPAQMFAREEEESEQTEPEIQMKSGKSLSTDIESAIQARFGTPTIQEKGMPINSDPALENEADVMGAEAAQGKMADVTGTGNGVQRQTDEETTEEEPEAETETYIVTNSNAVIRSDTEPHDAVTTNKIPLGTKITVIDTYKKRSRVQYIADANKNYWTSTSNIDNIEAVNDTKLYTAFYNDIAIYSTPEGDASEIVLEVDKKYSILNKCETSKNKFYEVRKDGAENPVGWIKDYEYVLYGKDTTDREDKLKKFKDWLDERLTEAEAKTGDEKIKFVQGILGLIEKESENIAKDPPVYPNVDSLDKTPSYSETNNPDLNVAVPHELISITREFINITELTPVAEATGTTAIETTVSETETAETTEVETITGGSQHSGNDWNTRLGAPQYRTQSDNMSIPEATCNVTTMAMTLERLGNSRTDVIAAIDTKLKNGEEKTDAELKTLWEEKSKVYLERITTYAEEKDAETAAENDKNYLKLRQNKGGVVGKEDELSKKFKEIAQMEDLVDFYMYLKTSDLGKRYNIFTDSYNDLVPEDINSAANDKYKTERIDIGADGKRFSTEHRNKIKKTLDAGGSAVLSVYHKGTGTNSHIISVQSITSEGLYVDDPYGGHAQDYIKGSSGDLFKGKGKTGSRSNYEYKNVPHFNSNETDYTNRDFTAKAGQNLDDDESRGDSVLLKYKMINDSTSELINYIVLYEKK